MEIIRDKEFRPATSTIATIGTFDGVHLGHQKIIKDTVTAAKEGGRPAVLITFDKHPRKITAPGEKIMALTTIDSKIHLIKKFDLDYLILLTFNAETAALSPEDFCQKVLIRELKVGRLFVGENFRFGVKASGDVSFLKKFGEKNGFDVEIEPLLKVNGKVISSTEIRIMISDGEVEKIPRFLGRFHFVSGTVIKGAGRGVKIGYPTANLDPDPDLCLPKEGVYTGYIWTENRPYEAVINIGSNPTFGPGEVHLEAHVFDFSRDLYGKHIRVELQRYLRGEAKFSSVDRLTAQINKDAETARKWLVGSEPTAQF